MSKVYPDIDPEWDLLLQKLENTLGKRPSLDGILFLIGVQELGKGKRNFSKEEKQDLMHIGICRILSDSGYYELDGLDQDGWPHWKELKPTPKLSLEEQEKFLKLHIKTYFASFS